MEACLPARTRRFASRRSRGLSRRLSAAPSRWSQARRYEAVLWENVAYLVGDDRRAKAFEVLRTRVGLSPVRILAAGDALDSFGDRADRLREVATIVLELGGDLDVVLAGPLAEARRAVKRLPGIGDPGADWLLLLAGKLRTLAPESNALRVLLRLGYGEEKKSYAASYRSVNDAVADELPEDTGELISPAPAPPPPRTGALPAERSGLRGVPARGAALSLPCVLQRSRITLARWPPFVLFTSSP